jgi:ABC-type glycerol-3-phosphate transport system substrate-binding protein
MRFHRAAGVLLVAILLGASVSAAGRANPAGPKGTTISLWAGGVLTSATPGSSPRAWLDAQIARFKRANPGSNVSVTLLPNDLNALAAQVQAAFASGKTPDVMTLWSGNLTLPYAQGLMPLNQYIKATPGFYKAFSGWDLSCANYACQGGKAKIYAVPIEAGGYFLFYNKRIFRKAGIAGPPRTYKQLFADCQTLSNAGVLPIAYGAHAGYDVSNTFTPNLVSTFHAGDVQRLLSRKMKYTDPKMVSALQAILDLAPSKYGCTSADSFTTDTLPGAKPFMAGTAAMTVQTGQLVSDMRKALGTDLGAARLPVSGSGPLLKVGSGYAANSFANWMIPQAAANPALAWDFIKILTDRTGSVGILKQLGETPANRAAAATVSNPLDKFLARLVAKPAIVNIDQVLPENVALYFYSQLELAFQGKLTAPQAMRNVQKYADTHKK